MKRIAPPATWRSVASGPVGNLRISVEHFHHALDVGQTLFDFAVDHAHEVQRHEELQHQQIDHRELADGTAAREHVVGGHDQADRQRDGEDHGLPGVQNRERGIGFDARLFVERHRLVVALRLAIFGAEVFHGLVVEQAVDGLRVGVGVAFVHRAADGEPPFGSADREPQVADDHPDDGRDVAPVELDGADDDDHEEFDDRRNEGHQRHAADVFNARPAAFQNARQPARLAFEMKAHRQPVHVLERRQRQLPDGVHRNAREHALAHLNQQRHHDARQPIEDARQHWRTDEPGHAFDLPAHGHRSRRRARPSPTST